MFTLTATRVRGQSTRFSVRPRTRRFMTDVNRSTRTAVELTAVRRARWLQADELRESGKTFREIGAALGVTETQARNLAFRGAMRRKRGPTDQTSLDALTAGAQSALWSLDCYTRVDAERVLRSGVRVGSVPGLGAIRAREIAGWLGVPVIESGARSSSASRPRGAVPAGVGARLREERERLGLSQDGLAAALGLAIKTVYNYERELTSVTLAFLDEFARIGGDVEYVIFGRRAG